MSMSTSIRAFIPDSDPEYQKHKKVLLACHEAGISLPKETAEYFDCEYAELYLLEEKLEITLQKDVHFTIYSGEMEEGFEIEIKNLPQGVDKIRFYNSY